MELELISDLKAARADRPDEYSMDRFIRKAERLKKAMVFLSERSVVK